MGEKWPRSSRSYLTVCLFGEMEVGEDSGRGEWSGRESVGG